MTVRGCGGPSGRLARAGRLVAAIVLAAGMIGAPSAGAVAAEPTVVRHGVTWENYDSMNVFASWPWWFPGITYQQLAALGPDLQWTGWFAESWTASEDALTWTFKISPDKKWSDGEPATANDVAFTFNYLLGSVGTPDELTAGWDNTAYIQQVVESVAAPDAQTVVLKLKKPSSFPLDNNLYIVPEHVWKDVSYADALSGAFKNEPPTVGSGPYFLSEFDPNQLERYTRNPYFEGPGPYVDEHLFIAYENPEAAAQALLAGDIDTDVDVPQAMIEKLRGTEGIVTQTEVLPAYTALVYNTRGTEAGSLSDATADPAFRSALGYAIDRQTLVDRAYLGLAEPGESIVSPIFGTTADRIHEALGTSARTFDPDEARRRLEEAGYTDGDGDGVREDKAGKPLELRLAIDGSDAQQASVAQYLTGWFEDVGVSVTAQAMDSAVLMEKRGDPENGGGDWDLNLAGYWSIMFPSDYMMYLTTARIGVWNWSYWSNAQYDDLYAQLTSTVDPELTASITKDMALLAYDQLPMDVLAYSKSRMAYRTDKYTGWVDQPTTGGNALDSWMPILSWQSVRPVDSTEPSASAGAPATASPTEGGAATASPSPSGGGTTASDGTGPILAVGVAAVVIAVLGALFLRGRRKGSSA